jgi:hypothetical protein
MSCAAFLLRRGGQLLHPLPEARQGLVLSTFETAERVRGGERPCSGADLPALARFPYFSLFRARVNADQVINHLFSFGPTVLQVQL